MSEPRIKKLKVGTQALVVISSASGSDPKLLESLSKAEREVATLALEGHSDLAIAQSRRVSPRTVANQLRSIYRKLRVNNRSELALKLSANIEPPPD